MRTAVTPRRLAATASALALCSCTTIPAKRTETITITEKQSYPICMGVCIDYSVSISSDGDIDSHAHRLFPGEYRYKLPSQAAADIIARFDRIRPQTQEPVVPCRHDPSKNMGWDSRELGNAPWLVVRWSGSIQSQLVRCDFDAVTRQAVEKTMTELRLFVGIPQSVVDRATKAPAPSPCTVRPWLRNCLQGT